MTPEAHARWTSFRRALHRAPELSGQEKETASRIVDKLIDYVPDDIVTNIGGHGVAAVFKGAADGPTVMIRCELDGLPIQEIPSHDYGSEVPGKGHLCGHDGHMVMVLALAEALDRQRPARGRAVLLFQPAEETGQGAAAMRADPAFEKLAPDYVFALHNVPGLPLGSVHLCSGAANCASRGMRIELTGKTSHAAAPEDGLSPMQALAELMPALATLGPGGARTAHFALTTVTHANLGAPSFGVAPGQGELWVTLRTVSDAKMQSLIKEAEAIVRKTTAAQGLDHTISYHDVFEACTNHPRAVEVLQTACTALNKPVTMQVTPQSWSEDFGQFGKTASTAMFWLGSGEACPQLHNPDYDFPDALIPIGSDVFEATLRKLLG